MTRSTAANGALAALGKAGGSAVGIALMIGGIFLFAVNDVLGKWLVATYSVAQIMLIRSLAAFAVLAFFLRGLRLAEVARPQRPRLHLLRAVFSGLEVSAFYWAVYFLPLADAMAYYLAAPIYVAALSPWLLGERVGWRRWVAIAVGFLGVLVVLDPSPASFTGPALIALAGSLFFTALVITTRQLAGAPDRVLVIWQTAGTLIAGAAMAPFAWVAPGAFDFGLLALLGVVAMLAHFAVNRSLKLAPAATVAPFQYTLLLWAIVFGYLVFGDVPTAHMLAGSAIIVAAGLFIFFREQMLKRGAARAALTVDPPA